MFGEIPRAGKLATRGFTTRLNQKPASSGGSLLDHWLLFTDHWYVVPRARFVEHLTPTLPPPFGYHEWGRRI